tara:strand:- start:384 stop:518 length:135 start_codon:yes stop_codon:yes gene_type:complete
MKKQKIIYKTAMRLAFEKAGLFVKNDAGKFVRKKMWNVARKGAK